MLEATSNESPSRGELCVGQQQEYAVKGKSQRGLDTPASRGCEKSACAHPYSRFILRSQTHMQRHTPHPFLSPGSSLAYGISATAGSKTNIGL